LGRRVFYLNKIANAVVSEAGKDKNFVFPQSEIQIIREANSENLNMMAGSKNYLDQNTFSDAPVTLLNNIYDMQDKIYRSTDMLGSANLVSQKSAIKIKSKSKSVLYNENLELFKYQFLDEINFKLFCSRFKEYIETEQTLFNFT
jgi:hypothetical protein